MATFATDKDTFFETSNDHDRAEWVPLSLTLVEYPKGKLWNLCVYFHPE